jgi:hypothetical protein
MAESQAEGRDQREGSGGTPLGRGHDEVTLLSKQLRWRSQLVGRSMIG